MVIEIADGKMKTLFSLFTVMLLATNPASARDKMSQCHRIPSLVVLHRIILIRPRCAVAPRRRRRLRHRLRDRD